MLRITKFLRCATLASWMVLGISALPAVEAIPTPASAAAIAAPALDADHAIWGAVLAQIVRPDGVDYAAVQRLQPELDRYRFQLAHAVEPTATAERLAFFINAYNALTVQLVASKLPADQKTWPDWSITLIGPPAGNAWKGYSFVVAGVPRTLDAIENAVLRPLGEPRIHFAINCASRSCPTLSAQAYRAATLTAQLANATAAFAHDPTQLRLADGHLRVNPILDWFAADFAAAGGVRKFLLSEVTEPGPLATQLAGADPLQFFIYDWRLNLAHALP